MFRLVQWIERHTYLYYSIETLIIEIHGELLEHLKKWWQLSWVFSESIKFNQETVHRRIKLYVKECGYGM